MNSALIKSDRGLLPCSLSCQLLTWGGGLPSPPPAHCSPPPSGILCLYFLHVGVLKLCLPSEWPWGFTSPKWELGCGGRPLIHPLTIHMILIQSSRSGFSAQGREGGSQGAGLARASWGQWQGPHMSGLQKGGHSGDLRERSTTTTDNNDDTQHVFGASSLRQAPL